MHTKTWAIAVIAACATACGGAPAADGGSGAGGSGGGSVPPGMVGIEVFPVPADLSALSEAHVLVGKDIQDYADQGSLADYKAKPYAVDPTDPAFESVVVTLDIPGYKTEDKGFTAADLRDATGSAVGATLGVARDISGKGWTCTMTDYLNGTATNTETEIMMFIAMTPITDPFVGTHSFLCDVNGQTRFTFLLSGDTVSAEPVQTGTQETASGTIGADANTFDVEFDSADQNYQYKSTNHCTR